MKLLVTGGCGFIGSHFINLCLNKGDSVLNIDKLTYAANENYIKKNANYEFVLGDITDPTLFTGLNYTPDVIVNFAAESFVDKSIENQSEFLHTNVLGASNVFNYALSKKVPVLQISTDEVYGDFKDMIDKNDAGLRSCDLLNPSNPYAASKAAADGLLLSFIRTYGKDGFKGHIVRMSNNYGPHQHEEKLLPKCIFNLKNGNPIPLYSMGENKRQWIYVKDSVITIYKIISLLNNIHWSTWECKYMSHVSSPYYSHSKTNIELIVLLAKLMNKRLIIDLVPDRKGHDKEYRIKDTLDGLDFTNLEDGLRETIDWYCNLM